MESLNTLPLDGLLSRRHRTPTCRPCHRGCVTGLAVLTTYSFL
jgi:hypothetical protein